MLFSSCISVIRPACPVGWVLHGKSCFLIINILTLNWSDARRTCQNLGGDLAIIRTAEENNFIFGLVKKQTTITDMGVWLGFKRELDNKFYWIDDTPLTRATVLRGEVVNRTMSITTRTVATCLELET